MKLSGNARTPISPWAKTKCRFALASRCIEAAVTHAFERRAAMLKERPYSGEHIVKKTILISVAALAFGAADAFAADLPAKVYTKTPPALATTVYDWSGLYVGLNVGGASGHTCWS